MIGVLPLTSQIDPDELTAFIDGSLPPVIRMTRGLSSPMLRFVRGDDRVIRIEIPRTPHPNSKPFDIVAATDVMTFTAERHITAQSITFTIRTRHELRNVISIATRHLGWSNDDEIGYVFAEHGASQFG